jgi:hypothetical protein
MHENEAILLAGISATEKAIALRIAIETQLPPGTQCFAPQGSFLQALQNQNAKFDASFEENRYIFMISVPSGGESHA